MFLPKTTKIFRRGMSALHTVHRYGMEKRFDLDIASLALQRAATKIYQNHLTAADRLEAIINTSFYIDIHEFPFRFLVTIKANRVLVDCNMRYPPNADVYISGDYHSLAQIFEGDEDGDSLFFSRKIKVQGNIEALVTLRNAIDNEDVDLVGELAELFGPLHRPAKDVLTVINKRLSAQPRHVNFVAKESQLG